MKYKLVKNNKPKRTGYYWVEVQPDLMIPVLFWYVIFWQKDEGWLDELGKYATRVYGPIEEPEV